MLHMSRGRGCEKQSLTRRVQRTWLPSLDVMSADTCAGKRGVLPIAPKLRLPSCSAADAGKMPMGPWCALSKVREGFADVDRRQWKWSDGGKDLPLMTFFNSILTLAGPRCVERGMSDERGGLRRVKGRPISCVGWMLVDERLAAIRLRCRTASYSTSGGVEAQKMQESRKAGEGTESSLGLRVRLAALVAARTAARHGKSTNGTTLAAASHVAGTARPFKQQSSHAPPTSSRQAWMQAQRRRHSKPLPTHSSPSPRE